MTDCGEPVEITARAAIIDVTPEDEAARKARAAAATGTDSGITEADDMENWVYASAAAQGAVARRRNFNYQLALGQARPAPGLTGAVESGSYSEENARIFYRRWAQFMNRED